ncbi:MAG: non-canonical purine NTP pyrophosphatase, partial [Bacteriovoracaceae bacterium]|nr:non-canonical purine NTP pyrophosphatase [Bacteriovoracaceae bacterium]
MFEFMLASSNAHKAQELQLSLAGAPFKIISAPKKIAVIEDGKSYYENAFKKAAAYAAHFKVPVVADDSGLEVDALPGELGIHSARFGGQETSDQAKVDLLLQRMQKFSALEQRKAHYTCVLCFYFAAEEVYFFTGELHGHLAMAAQGTDGFGYDPIFIP